MKKVLFEESQNSSSVVLVAPLAIVAFMFTAFAVSQIVFHKQIGNRPAPNWLLVAMVIGLILAIIVFSRQKITLKITEDEIIVSYGILAGKQIVEITNVKELTVKKHDAFSGDTALEITPVHSKEKILIRTKKNKELETILKAHFQNITTTN